MGVGPVPDQATEQVELELTALVQRVLRGSLLQDGSGRTLERPAYAVLARLHDDGSMRLSALATLLELDPSTVSRHVQGLVEAGLAERRPDPGDRRATRVELTERGRERLLATRRHRRDFLHRILEAWPAADRADFAALLARFNTDVRSALPGPPGTPAADLSGGDPALADNTTSATTGGPRP